MDKQSTYHPPSAPLYYPSPPPLLIRRATLADCLPMARNASNAFFDSTLTAYLCPLRHTYPQDLTRRLHQLMRRRYLDARTVSLVVVDPATTPHTVLAHAHFHREGNDIGAQRVIRERVGVIHTLQQWWFRIWDKVVNILRPDRSANRAALDEFDRWIETDEERYWSDKRYADRWHVYSVVVRRDWQGRGIGSRLMREVMMRAEQEGVVVGLEASPEGEKMYRKLGFEMRGAYCNQPPGEVGGGVMMWTPPSAEKDGYQIS